MRVVFTNLHCNNLIAKPLSFFFVGRPCTYKHFYFLKYLFKNKIKMAVYLDGKSSSFQYKSIKFVLPQKVEFFLWAILNRLNPFRFELINHVNQTAESDILFFYVFGTVEDKFYDSFRGLKVCHLSHYMQGIKDISNSLKKKNINIFVSENNLKKNSPFFNKYFEWFDGDFYVLPHVPQKRFKKSIDFAKRLNKAVATGTTFKYINSDFNDFFKVQYYHPMRQKIYEHQHELQEIIDCYIEDYLENKAPKTINKNDNIFNSLYKKLYNSFYLGKQSRYHSLNFPDLYNKYKIAIIGEEVNNLPGIGFVESMSCGCAYIGLNDPMYTDLGMIPDKHYIVYDGSLEGLKEKLSYYTVQADKLSCIAKRGHDFIVNSFTDNIVCQNLLVFLEKKLGEKIMKYKELNKFEHIITHLTQEEKIKLYELAQTLQNNSNVVEIGSYLGASACCIANGLINKDSKFYCIDTWDNDSMSEGKKDTYEEFNNNIKQFKDIVRPVRGYSYDVVNQIQNLTNFKIDLLFIDGDHSYEGVKKDWDLYSQMLKSGSIVIFHDIGWAQGVKRVVNENVKHLISKDSNFELPNMYWAWIK